MATRKADLATGSRPCIETAEEIDLQTDVRPDPMAAIVALPPGTRRPARSPAGRTRS